MATIRAGSIIAGKYHVERALSQGGMGSLWVARQLQLQRLVAVKLMEPSLAASPASRSRFEREAQAAALIQSPHVVQIHDYGVEHDTPYIVMELLEGEDLGRRLKRQRRLPIATVARIFGQICKALRKAHEAGMVHLDLKPANIFLARDDDDEIVKVLDFGIAKMINADAATEVTATGVVLGSVHYMSPEQVRGRRGLDHRSDLWSLGVIAFRAITGELPFGGTQIGDVLVKVCADPIPRASSVFPGVDPAVEAFLLRALERDPEARFQSARELAAALALLAWQGTPETPRPPQISLSNEIAPIDSPRVVLGPAIAIAAPAPSFSPMVAMTHAPLTATTKLPPDPPPSSPSWRAPADAGTLTGSPRVSDLPTTMQHGAAPKRAWGSAILAAFGLVAVVAAGVIGSLALSGRHAKTTAAAALSPVAAAPSELPPPSSAAPTPPPPALSAAPPPIPEPAREIDLEAAAPPAKTPGSDATTTTTKTKGKAATAPTSSAQTKTRSAPSSPPPPKKLNPELGF
jgi:serine/threonine-protein kinase